MMNEEIFSVEAFQNRTVKDMPPDEQPREKLMKYGASTLSDAELLAILLRTGTKKLNVINTAKALLHQFDGLHNLVRKNWKALKVIPGIAGVKAITLEAAFELARRIQVAALGEEIQFTSPENVNAYFGPKLRHLNKEQFLVAFLNNRRVMTGYQTISTGGQTATIVDPAEVMRQAVLAEATSVILIHNHPSGNNRASTADVQLTKRLAEAGDILGIPVDDHVIIAGYNFVSMKNEHLF